LARVNRVRWVQTTRTSKKAARNPLITPTRMASDSIGTVRRHGVTGARGGVSSARCQGSGWRHSGSDKRRHPTRSRDRRTCDVRRCSTYKHLDEFAASMSEPRILNVGFGAWTDMQRVGLYLQPTCFSTGTRRPNHPTSRVFHRGVRSANVGTCAGTRPRNAVGQPCCRRHRTTRTVRPFATTYACTRLLANVN